MWSVRTLDVERIDHLTLIQDESRLYDTTGNVPARPGYLGPHKTDTSLLQTCQRIYSETCFLPWTLKLHTFWIAWRWRQPPEVEGTIPPGFENTLRDIYKRGGEVPIQHVRIFAMLWEMRDLHSILTLPFFFPRKLTITIRHTDWWQWEMDWRLRILPEVCESSRGVLPASVQEVRMELESLKRKKAQVDYVAGEMVDKWWFLRSDDVVMMPLRGDFEVTEWSGSSTWGRLRWVRDETKAEMVEYYVKTVTWKPSLAVKHEDLAEPETISAPRSRFKRVGGRMPHVNTSEIEMVGVPPGTHPEEVVRMVMDFRGSDWEHSSDGGSVTDDDYD